MNLSIPILDSLSLTPEELATACATACPFYGGSGGRMRGLGFPYKRLSGASEGHRDLQSTWFDEPSGPVCREAVVRTSYPWGVRTYPGGTYLRKETMTLTESVSVRSFTDPTVFQTVWDAAVARRGEPHGSNSGRAA